MNHPAARLFALSGLLFFLLPASAGEQDTSYVWEHLKVGATPVDYAIALPPGIQPKGKGAKAQPAPLLLLLTGGPTGKEEVGQIMDGLARPFAQAGWIVVSPAAPGGRLFFQGGEAVLPGLLAHLASRYDIDPAQRHVAGSSNGGIGAFHLAVQDPRTWASVLAFPGAVISPADFGKLGALKGKSVTMYAGDQDELQYHVASQRISAELTRLGIEHQYLEMKGQGHIPDVPAATLVEDLERHRKAVSASAKP